MRWPRNASGVHATALEATGTHAAAVKATSTASEAATSATARIRIIGDESYSEQNKCR
jgi:hypothetical protein